KKTRRKPTTFTSEPRDTQRPRKGNFKHCSEQRISDGDAAQVGKCAKEQSAPRTARKRECIHHHYHNDRHIHTHNYFVTGPLARKVTIHTIHTTPSRWPSARSVCKFSRP